MQYRIQDTTEQGRAGQCRTGQNRSPTTYYHYLLPISYYRRPTTCYLLATTSYLVPITYTYDLRLTIFYYQNKQKNTIKNYLKTITETNDKHQETTINTNTKVNTKIQQEAHGLCYVMLKSWYGLLCQVMVFCVSI